MLLLINIFHIHYKTSNVPSTQKHKIHQTKIQLTIELVRIQCAYEFEKRNRTEFVGKRIIIIITER